MKSNRPKVGTAVFVCKKGKFLLGKRKSELGDGKWCIPGGHLEFGESFEECVKRETLEESNVNIKNVEFLGVANDVVENKHYVTIFMISDYDSGEVIPQIEEFHEWRWGDLESLPKNLFSIFENFLGKNKKLVEKKIIQLINRGL